MYRLKKVSVTFASIFFMNFMLTDFVNAETIDNDIGIEINTENHNDNIQALNILEENGNSEEIFTEENIINYALITEQYSIEYYGTVKAMNSGIYTAPQGTENSILYTHYLYNWKDVKVVEEAVTENGVFSKLVEVDSGELIGWILKHDLMLYGSFISSVTTDAIGYVLPSNKGIFTLPPNMYGSRLFTSYLYNWKDVKVMEESVTQSGTYLKLMDISSNNLLGWISKDDIKLYDSITERKKVKYFGQVKKNNTGIHTLPNGNYEAILFTSYLYNNKDVEVIEEAVTQSGTFARIKNISSNVILGWINKNELDIYDEIEKENEVEYYAKIKANNRGIYTQPNGSYGSKLYTSYLHNGEYVYVKLEATTQRGSFVKVFSLPEGKELGWINTVDIEVVDFSRATKSTEFFGIVKTKNDGIYTEPKGAFDSVLYTSYLMNNKAVKVIKEANTINGVYVLLQKIDDNSIVGWIKKDDIEQTNFIKSTTSNIGYGKIIPGNKGIFTRPKGDFKSLLYTWYLYNNQDVKILEEVNTLTGRFYKIGHINTEAILGWISKDDVSLYSNLINITKMNSYGRVKTNNAGIYTLPKGTKGAKLYTSYLYNSKDVRITERASNAGINYVKLLNITDNSFIGWIKETDVSFANSIISKEIASFEAIVSSSNDGIYTEPKGVYGAKLYTSYLHNNKKVKVIEQAKTSEGEFAKITTLDGSIVLGWIKLNDLVTSKTVFLDVGHGGKDSGANYYGVMEKTINLQISKKIETLLISKGFNVTMSRTTDVFIDHSTDRSKMANASGADIFVSVHNNAMPNNTIVNGIETFYYKYDPEYPSKINGKLHNDPTRIKESADLAYAIHNALIKRTAAFDRGVRRETFAVLRETALPSVLLELGFMSNRTELNRLTSDSYQNILAQAVVEGIENYFK